MSDSMEWSWDATCTASLALVVRNSGAKLAKRWDVIKKEETNTIFHCWFLEENACWIATGVVHVVTELMMPENPRISPFATSKVEAARPVVLSHRSRRTAGGVADWNGWVRMTMKLWMNQSIIHHTICCVETHDNHFTYERTSSQTRRRSE